MGLVRTPRPNALRLSTRNDATYHALFAEKVDNFSSKTTTYSAGVDRASLESDESDKPDTPLNFHYNHTCSISRIFINRSVHQGKGHEKQGALPSRHNNEFGVRG